jgi:flagellar biosynthesis protein FlhF
VTTTPSNGCAAFVGPAGAGKTTTIAKLAGHLVTERDLSVRLHTFDDFRLSGAAQLMAYAELLGLDFGVGDLKLVEQPTAVLVDTPGVMPGERERIEELARRLAAIRPSEVHLVLPGTVDLRFAISVAEALAPLGADRLVVTQVDELWVRSRVADIARELALPVSYLGTGPQVPVDFVGRDPGEVSRYLAGDPCGIGHGERDAGSSRQAA